MGLVGCFNVFESLLCCIYLIKNTVKTVEKELLSFSPLPLWVIVLYTQHCGFIVLSVTALVPVGAPSVCGILALCALLHGISAVISPNCFPGCAVSTHQVHNNNILDKYFLRFINVCWKYSEKKTISTFSSSPFWESGKGLLSCGFSISSFKSSKCCLRVWVVCFIAFCFFILSHTCFSNTVWAPCTAKISVNIEESLKLISGPKWYPGDYVTMSCLLWALASNESKCFFLLL